MTPRARWQLAPEGGQAAEGWLSLHDLDLPEAAQAACAASLSADERQRAERRRFPADRLRFIAARGQLRAVLGELIDVEPSSLRFQYGADGKPALAAPFDRTGLQFNVSHSGSALLVAVVAGGPVGVDLERHRPLHDRDALVRRHFSAAENAEYFALREEAERQQAFFTAWARKEALVKALGRGLRFPLRDFDVSLQRGAATALLRLRQDGVDRHFPETGWWLGASDIFPEFGSALALPCRDCRMRPL